MNKKRILPVLIAIILGITSLLSGCGGQQAEEPQKELQVAFAARYETPVSTWDPSIMSDTGNQILHNIYEMLLKYDANTDTFIPVLATEYSKSDDGLLWTLIKRRC